MARNLVYTVALDPGGSTGHRNLAKLLVSSLLRTRFSGDILVFHNARAPLFMVPREGVREMSLEMPELLEKDGDFAGFAQSCKHRVGRHLDASGYEKVMFIDSDSVVLRNIDHLLAGSWELAVFAEPHSRIQHCSYGGYLTPAEWQNFTSEGFNSGTWAVAAARAGELLQRWEEVQSRPASQPGCFPEQSAFNRVALDWAAVRVDWPRSEIALPLCNADRATYRGYTQAAIVHAAGGDGLDHKLRFLFSTYAGAFLFDPQLALFNILEM